MPASSPEARARKNAAKSAKMKALRAETSRREAAGEPLDPEHQAIVDARTKRKVQYGDTKKVLTSATKPSKDVSKAAIARVLSRNTKLTKQTSGKITAPSMSDVYGSIDSRPEYEEQIRKNSAVNLNPINNDKSHHSVLATVAQTLENKTNEGEETGSLKERDVTTANNHIADFWGHHSSSLQQHDLGNPELAKEHFKNAADSLLKAHDTIANKRGVVLRAGVRGFVGQASRNYLFSKTPGVGAQPHEDWAPKGASYKSGSAPVKESDGDSIEDIKEKLNYAKQRREIDAAAQNTKNILGSKKQVYDIKITSPKQPTYAKPDEDNWSPPPLASSQYSHFIRGSRDER
jgi:hypothetical protein